MCTASEEASVAMSKPLHADEPLALLLRGAWPDASFIHCSAEIGAMHYWLSLRGLEPKPDGRPVRLVPTATYGDVRMKKWEPPYNLNSDPTLHRVWTDPASLAAMFFPIQPVDYGLWLVTIPTRSRMVERAVSSGIGCRRLGDPDRGIEGPGTAWAFCIDAPDRLTQLIPPGATGDLVDCTVLGVANEYMPSFERWQVPAGRYLAYDLFRASAGPLGLRVAEDLAVKCRYRYHSNIAFYDSPDPAYSVPAEYSVAFEAGISSVLDRWGFRQFRRPLLEPILSNWLGYAEIPVVDDGQADEWDGEM